MSAELGIAIGRAAPLYNLALVGIVIYLFIKLFMVRSKNKKVYLVPWKLLFLSVVVYIIEQVLTVLRQAEWIVIPAHINGFFELGIISIFIYVLLLQKQHLRQEYR